MHLGFSMTKNIAISKQIKQRLKGTHDSPCLSICTHKQGDRVCQACGMVREEKKGWKKRSEQEKFHIRLKAEARFSTLEKNIDDDLLVQALPNPV